MLYVVYVVYQKLFLISPLSVVKRDKLSAQNLIHTFFLYTRGIFRFSLLLAGKFSFRIKDKYTEKRKETGKTIFWFIFVCVNSLYKFLESKEEFLFCRKFVDLGMEKRVTVYAGVVELFFISSCCSSSAVELLCSREY